jgi:A/G-specific adenine glycosylase
MLQQTRVAVVIPYYEKFLERFPNIVSLAVAPQEEVLRYWAGLGYYSRARNMQKAAQQIVTKHNGKFPTRRDDILALPGIGNYTAAAISSIAFAEHFAVLDGNVARVLARLGVVRGNLRAPARWQGLQRNADALLDPESSGDWNQAMMELGATLCTPKSPQCLLCPIANYCAGRKLGLAESLPEKQKKRASVEVILAAAVFTDAGGRTLLLAPPRKSRGKTSADHIPTLVSGMWHFPTVSVTNDATKQLRAILRKLSPVMRNGDVHLLSAGTVRHCVTYRAITVLPFRVRVKKLPRIAGAKRMLLHDVSHLAVSSLTRKVAAAALTV